MHVRCEHCSVKGNIPDSAVDKTVRCPRCGGQFKVTMALVEQGAERRKAERVHVENMDLDFGFFMGTAQVRDISTTGVGIAPSDTDYDFVPGQEVQFNLVDNHTSVMQSLPAKITRSGQTASGLEFHGLSKHQLSELKLLLARKKFEAEQQAMDANEDINLEMDESELKRS
jgi:hypothetical protein